MSFGPLTQPALTVVLVFITATPSWQASSSHVLPGFSSLPSWLLLVVSRRPRGPSRDAMETKHCSCQRACSSIFEWLARADGRSRPRCCTRVQRHAGYSPTVTALSATTRSPRSPATLTVAWYSPGSRRMLPRTIESQEHSIRGSFATLIDVSRTWLPSTISSASTTSPQLATTNWPNTRPCSTLSTRAVG